MRLRYPGICIVLLIFSSIASAQSPAVIDSIRVLNINPRTFQSNDTVWTYSVICKALRIVRVTGQPLITTSPALSKSSFIKVSGNLMYDYLYRSFADTPFYQKDFRQHTLQTSMTITVRDEYPIHV